MTGTIIYLLIGAFFGIIFGYHEYKHHWSGRPNIIGANYMFLTCLFIWPIVLIFAIFPL